MGFFFLLQLEHNKLQPKSSRAGKPLYVNNNRFELNMASVIPSKRVNTIIRCHSTLPPLHLVFYSFLIISNFLQLWYPIFFLFFFYSSLFVPPNGNSLPFLCRWFVSSSGTRVNCSTVCHLVFFFFFFFKRWRQEYCDFVFNVHPHRSGTSQNGVHACLFRFIKHHYIVIRLRTMHRVHIDLQDQDTTMCSAIPSIFAFFFM